MTGSGGTLQNELLAAVVNPIKTELGTETFLLVDFRLNG
jgi:hypothetical protein